MIEPIKKTRLYEDIVQQFMKKIENEELQPGSKLPTEHELAQQMGVSRTSIREALRSMELLGIVESRVGDGTYVQQASLDGAFGNFGRALRADKELVDGTLEMRYLLESFSAKKAAMCITRQQLDQMYALLDQMASAPDKDSPIVAQCDVEIHKIIAEASGNRALCSVLNLCEELFRPSMEAALHAHHEISDVVREHREIIDAIAAHNAPLAEKLMKQHLSRARVNIRHSPDEKTP